MTFKKEVGRKITRDGLFKLIRRLKNSHKIGLEELTETKEFIEELMYSSDDNLDTPPYDVDSFNWSQSPEEN